jgi:hypothetical protein
MITRILAIVLFVCLSSATYLLAYCFTPLPHNRRHARGIVTYNADAWGTARRLAT